MNSETHLPGYTGTEGFMIWSRRNELPAADGHCAAPKDGGHGNTDDDTG